VSRISLVGSSTIECLVALSIFAIGVLGASGALALSLRLATEGDRAAAAARLLADEQARLNAGVAANGGRCSGAVPGGRQTSSGVGILSAATSARGGLALTYEVSYATVRGQHADTTIGFIPCH